jgi:chromosome segregation ATPase
MIFKGFKFGKNKDKEKEKKSADDAASTQIAELEEHLKERTDDLAETEMKLKELSGKISEIEEVDTSELRPHGPIGELSIEPEDSLSGVDTDEEEEEEDVLEIKKKPEDAVPEPKEKAVDANSAETKEEGTYSASTKRPDKQLDAESLKALFTSEEEEENPLAGLINSLPDVSVDELMDDLKEIKDIIKDWQNK